MPTREFVRNKMVLAVIQEQDVLEIIEEEFSFETANVTLRAATTFENAREYLVSYTYDLALLDIWGSRDSIFWRSLTTPVFPWSYLQHMRSALKLLESQLN